MLARDDALAREGDARSASASRLANEAETALEIGEQLAHEDVMYLKRTSERTEGRGAERAGGGAVEVVGGGEDETGGVAGGGVRAPEAAYAMPEAPEGEVFEEFDERRATTTVESFLNTDAVNYRGTCAIGTNRRRASTAPSSKINPRRARRRKLDELEVRDGEEFALARAVVIEERE